MTKSILDKLDEAEKAATTSSWIYSYGDDFGNNRRCLFDGKGYLFGQIDDGANGELITLMRNNIRALIDIAKAAEELKQVHSKLPFNMYGDYSKRQDMVDAMGALFLRLNKLNGGGK